MFIGMTKYERERRIREAVRKVLHAPGSSKAAKTKRGSALSQR